MLLLAATEMSVCLSICHTLRPYQDDASQAHPQKNFATGICKFLRVCTMLVDSQSLPSRFAENFPHNI